MIPRSSNITTAASTASTGTRPAPVGWIGRINPDPFRRYAGAAAIRLPLAADALPTRYAALRRGDLSAMRAFDVHSIAVLFELSLGLSAWKSFGGNRWALRCNPSSGNLLVRHASRRGPVSHLCE